MDRAAVDLPEVAAALRSGLRAGRRGGFAWFGTTHGGLGPAVWDAMAPGARTAFRVEMLANHLYPHLYCHGQVVADPAELPVNDDGVDLAAALREAHGGVTVADPAWEVTAVDDWGAVAERGGLRARFPPESLADDGRSVRVTTAEPSLSPGYFLVRGARDLDFAAPTYRFYLSLTPAGRVSCLRELTTALGVAGTPYRFKALSRPGVPHRADSAVLYVNEADLDDAAAAIAAARSAWERWAVPGVPALTKPLAPEVGFAQDPGNGASFGESRCRAVARAWVDWEDAGRPEDGLIERIVQQLADAGVDPERPHLNAGGRDVTLPAVAFTAPVRRPSAMATAPPPAPRSLPPRRRDADTLLEVARSGGDALVESAIWSGDRCQWIARRPVRPDGQGPVAGTLAPDLYGGLAGVALFLVESGRVLGLDRHVETGLGAARAALRACAREFQPGGLYTGSAGVLATVADLAGTVGGGEGEELRRETVQLVDDMTARLVDHRAGRSVNGRVPSTEPDMLMGHAGEIAALLRLAAALGRPDLVDHAVEVGQELCRSAVPRGEGVGWVVGVERTPRVLAGFTHGGAGIAYALDLLHRSAPRPEFRETARLAIVGEDTFLRAGRANWLDARAGEALERFSFYWCHGLPGILLSRLQAWRLDPGDGGVARTVEWATGELARRVRQTERNTRELCLCHGVCGNAEVLMAVDPGYRAVARGIYAGIAGEQGTDLANWPVGRGLDRGLLTGIAGVGLSYLRVVTEDPRTVLQPCGPLM